MRQWAMGRLWVGGVDRMTVAALIGAAALPAGAQTQYVRPPMPEPAATIRDPGTVAVAGESPADSLSRNLRILATQPRDYTALVAAGRAALALGDQQTAAGFFGRAEEVNPNSWAPKIGLGATLLQSGDAAGALTYFDEAERLGATRSMLGTERGLALDLLGRQREAQADYRAGMGSGSADEARRRVALSLAISGDKAQALALLDRPGGSGVRDTPDAARVRGFVLALTGDVVAATQLFDAVMAGSGERFAPYLSRLAGLSAPQLAAAVHLGIFPGEEPVRTAQATPPPPAARPSSPVRPGDTPSRRVSVADEAPRIAPIVAPSVARATAPEREIGQSFDGTSSPAAIAQRVAARGAAARAEEPLRPLASTSRLASIDQLLATPPDPAAERAAAERADRAAKARAAREAKADREAKAKAERDAKAKSDRDAKAKADREAEVAAKAKADAAKGAAGAIWVQLAGGPNEGNLAREYGRLAARQPKLLAGRPGHVSQGKDYFRLLIGPFPSEAKGRELVSQLKKAGIDAFVWHRTPAQIMIERIKR